MDRLNAMNAFVAVVDLNGFAPASRRLKMSPSGITRLIAGLEQHLGTALLRRTTRAMTLTDAGARYLERARRILAEVQEAEHSAHEEHHAPSGRLVITAPLTFGRIHVAPLMAAYLRQYKTVSGELILSDRFMNLVEDGIDLAVRIGHLDDSSLIARRAGSTRRVVVASPDYLRQRGAPRHPDDLHTHDTITLGGSGGAVAWRFMIDGAEQRVAVASRFTTNSADSAIAASIEGDGLAMVLAYQAADAVRDKKLSVVLDHYERPALPIQFVYPTSRLLSAKVRTFVDHGLATTRWEFG